MILTETHLDDRSGGIWKNMLPGKQFKLPVAP
jgi:hypothetical protein